MLNYRDKGTGTPIVLIHGFPLDHRMWRPQLEALEATGCRVICPDLPGFGESPPAREPVTMSSYADAVIDLLDQLNIDRAVIGGMSMGGYVLLNLLDRHPRRLTAAMFLVTRAGADDAAARDKRTRLAEEVRRGNHEIVPETFAQVLFAPATPEEQPELVGEVRTLLQGSPPEGLAAGLLAMRDRPDYRDRLGEFSLPALVVGAENDLAVPTASTLELAEGLPDATLRIIRQAGHLANLERPAEFNQALVAFLNTLK